jgi:hypothetical protein
MSIRKKLRMSAEMELHTMIEKLEGEALKICGDTPVDHKDLCRLVIGGRTQSVLNRVIGKMADRYEAMVIDRLEDEMPADENF